MLATPGTSATAVSSQDRPAAAQSKGLLQSLSKLFTGRSRPRAHPNTTTPQAASRRGQRLARGPSGDEVVALRDVPSSGAGPRADRRRSSAGRRTVSSSSSLRAASLESSDEQGPEEEQSRHHYDNDSAISGADEDASMRPLSPSSGGPPSFISATGSTSNSVAQTHRTYRSYASTKPTTLLSVESSGGGNRIAVVPETGAAGALSSSLLAAHALPGSTPSSALTFAAMPPPPAFLLPQAPPFPSTPEGPQLIQDTTINVPRYTLVHPRNNPHPASLPPDNASMLTLASSSFAPSFSHQSTSRSYSRSLRGLAGMRQSNLSIGGGTDADEDASLRALAPSRRASDESLHSHSTSLLSHPGVDKTASVVSGDRSRGRGQEEGEDVEGGIDRDEEVIGTPSVALASGGETEAQKVARLEGAASASVIAVKSTDKSLSPPDIPASPEPIIVTVEATSTLSV